MERVILAVDAGGTSIKYSLLSKDTKTFLTGQKFYDMPSFGTKEELLLTFANVFADAKEQCSALGGEIAVPDDGVHLREAQDAKGVVPAGDGRLGGKAAVPPVLSELIADLRHLPPRPVLPGEAAQADKIRCLLLDHRPEAEAVLGDDGRVLLRPSGTEPVVRVMVEAASQDDADRWARKLASVIEAL